MLFKKNIEITTFIESSMIIIRAVCKNKSLGIMKCTINEETKTITICDIDCTKNNKGYGSLMMKNLIEIAKQNNISCIDGWLAKTDRDHADRLYHFYEKFGFQIVPNDDGMKFADIKLVLQNTQVKKQNMIVL